MEIKIDKKLKIPIYMQIADGLKRQITSGKAAEDWVLPSERTMAKMLGVHRNTVAKAYNELKGQGFVESRQGWGYRVFSAEDDGAAEREKDVRPQGKKVNWMAEVKEEYMNMAVTFDELFQRFSQEDKISLGSGIAATGIYDRQELADRISRIAASEGRNQYFYSPYQGDEALRRQIVSYLRTKGIETSVKNIQILTETNQALDFLVNLLVKPGDTVITEEPVAPDTYRAFELAGAKIVLVPMDEEGMECGYLVEMIERTRPRFICLNSSFHDPTGKMLSPARKKKIMEISQKYRLPIIECDAASELYYGEEPVMPLKALDRLGNVVYVYSFSYTFAPGLSLAFVVAAEELIRRLSYLVPVRFMAMDWLSQLLMLSYLADGTYYSKLRDFRTDYREKRDLVCKKLERMRPLGVEYDVPEGGIYVWCRLPAGIDSKRLTSEGYNRGISLLPGYVFYPLKNGGREYVRLNFSYEQAERLAKGMDILEQTIREMLKDK